MKAQISAGIAATSALLFTATPAMATGGYHCKATDKSGVELSVGLSHTPIAGVLGITFIAGGKTYNTDLPNAEIVRGQSWFDDKKAMIDLVTAVSLRPAVHVRTVIDNNGQGRGTLQFRGKTHPIMCELE